MDDAVGASNQGEKHMLTAVTLATLATQNLLAVNLMLPSMRELAAHVGISVQQGGIILSVFFASYGFGLLVYGPLSDRFGRKPVLTWSLCLFIVGSLGCAMSSSLSSLLGGRFLQGAGAAGATIVAYAMASDLFSGHTFVRVTAYINAGRSLVPIASPALGGFLVELGSWRIPFFTMALLGFAMLGLSYRLKETLTQRIDTLSLWGWAESYRPLITARPFLLHATVAGLSYSTWVAMVTATPSIFMEGFKISATMYGIVYLLLAVSFIVGSLIVARTITVWRTTYVVPVGVALLFVSSASIFLPFWTNNIFVLGPMMAIGIMHGIVLSASSAVAMLTLRERAGNAFGLIAVLSMIGAAASSTFVSSLSMSPILNCALATSCFSLIALSLYVVSWCLARHSSENSLEKGAYP